MLVKAIESFAGKVSMTVGEVREIADAALAKDLLNAGYIEEAQPEAEEEKPAARKKAAKKH